MTATTAGYPAPVNRGNRLLNLIAAVLLALPAAALRAFVAYRIYAWYRPEGWSDLPYSGAFAVTLIAMLLIPSGARDDSPLDPGWLVFKMTAAPLLVLGLAYLARMFF